MQQWIDSAFNEISQFDSLRLIYLLCVCVCAFLYLFSFVSCAHAGIIQIQTFGAKCWWQIFKLIMNFLSVNGWRLSFGLHSTYKCVPNMWFNVIWHLCIRSYAVLHIAHSVHCSLCPKFVYHCHGKFKHVCLHVIWFVRWVYSNCSSIHQAWAIARDRVCGFPTIWTNNVPHSFQYFAIVVTVVRLFSFVALLSFHSSIFFFNLHYAFSLFMARI